MTNFEIHQTKFYACDFETVQKQHLYSHRQNNFENLLDNGNESDDEDYIPSPTYHCGLCSYNAMYADNVTFRYGEAHNIKMSWEEA